MPENNKYSAYTRGMDEAHARQVQHVLDMMKGPTTDYRVVDGEKEYSLGDYSQEIQNVLSNEQFGAIEQRATTSGVNKILELGGMDSESFFKSLEGKENPDSVEIEAMRATNYNQFADKETHYNSFSFSNPKSKDDALKAMYDEYGLTFQNSFKFPEMGKGLNEILPDFIKNDPEKQQQFETAFYNETGGAKIDFNESGQVGDLYTDSFVGNTVRKTGRLFFNTLNEVADSALGTANAIYDLAGGDPSKKDEEFLARQESGEVETGYERLQRFEKEGALGVGFDDPLFWASFSSPEARRQLYASSQGPLRAIDFQQIMDRGGVTEGTAGQLFGAGMDQLVQSAPLLLDLAGGATIAKGLLKGATKGMAKRAAAKSAGKSKRISKTITENSLKAQQRINQAGAFFVSDALVASQMHSDNVGQDWYDNLSGTERFTYLGIQAGAEVASGMVLGNIFARGFGPGKMTRNILTAERSAIKEYGKNIVRSTLLGATEEVFAEGATAAIQYRNEISARIKGGDESAYFDDGEFRRKVIEGATAGLLMGGLAGGLSGTVGGAAKATLATMHKTSVDAKKEQAKAAEAVNQAVTQTAKKDAMKRLEIATKKFTASQSAMARAYNVMAQADPEKFDEIARTQGAISALVQQHKASNDPEFQGAIVQEIKSLVEKKQELETEVAKSAGVEGLDELYKQEFDKVNKERETKEKTHRAKMESDPDLIAQREVDGQMEAQREAFEVAQEANSPEQNTDDDVQDAPEGQPTQEQPTQEKKSNKAEDLPEGSKNQEGKVGEPLDTMAIDSPRYREIAEKANVLLKSFKGVVGNVVIHTTAESFQKATNKDPEKTKGAITHRGAQKSTVHINLSHSNANIRTVRHEFLHAAFLGKSFKAKKALLKELQSVVKRYGDATADFGEGETITLKELIARIEQAYEGNEDIVEETVVNALEYFLNQDIFSINPSLGQRILNAWNSFFGSAVEKSDLEGFVQAFRDAESGKDFDVDLDKAQEAANQDRDMESRDLGPSRAYPDLQNSEVSYWIRNVNKMGGDMYNREQKVFKDYWHFRNWWAQETGNGKKASMIGGFEYIGKDGKKKTVNEPKPKVDRNTGEIVDMKPRLKTFNEWKKERLDKNTESRSQRINVETITNFIGFDVLKFIDNEFGRTTGIYDFEARPTQVPEGFDTDETFEFSGDQSMSYKSLKKAQREAEDLVTEIARAIPPNQRGKFMFRVTEKSKGVAQVELLSDSPGLYAQLKEAADAELDLDDSVSVFGGLESIDDIKSNGDAIAGGEVKTLESVVLEDLKISKSNNLGKDVNRGSVYELNGLLCRAFGYDRTKINSGVRNLFDRADKAVTAHKSKQDAENVFLSLREMAATVIREKGLKVGEIGYIATMQTLLGEESTLGNPNVFLDIINGKEGYFNVDSVGKALNRKGTGKNKAKFTGKTQKFRAKILQGLAVGDNQSLKDIQNAIRNDGDILLTQESLDVIKEILEDSSEDLSFKDRTAIANSFLDSSQKELIYAKHNDSVWANVGLAETVSYTIIPFKYEGETENGNIKISGFNTDIDQNKKSAFKGLIVYEPLTDSEGNDVPPPKIKVPKEAANLAQLFPNLEITIEEDSKISQKKISELTPKEQSKAVSTRAGISAVKGKVDITEPENTTRDQVSLDLSAPLEGTDSTLPFEPNRLNSFEAFMARMDQLFANKYANVMRLQKDIQKGLGKAVALSQDFINAETLLYGKTANDLAELDEKVKAISKELKEKGLTSDEVTEYLIARHAVERNALIKERNGEENGSGMTDEDAALVLNMPAEKKAKLESIAKKIDAIQKDTRDTMRKYGLETDERVDAWEAMFENYVPLGGLAIDDLNVESTLFPTGGAGISIYGDTTKKAKGRKSMAVNVLAQVVAQNAAIHVKARKNEALSSLYNLVKKNPSPRVWAIKKEVSVDSQNAVGVRIDGEQKFIVFNDPSYAKSLKNMGVEKLDVMSKLLRVPAAWLRRSFTTANPEFIISNFARDIQSALFNGLAESEIPGGLIQGRHIAAKVISRVKSTLPALIKGTFGKDLDPEMQAYFDEFKEDGGQTGWGFVKSLDQIAKEIEAESTEPGKVKQATKWMAKNSIDVIENLNDAFENSIRLAAYIEARKSGVSREKAAELAKNITVNFNRSGELGPVANAWYLFFNASVQGTARLARSLGTLKDVRKPNGELESWHKRLNASQKLAFGLSLTSGMLAAVNIAMSDEDEDGVLFYNKIPDYEKERNLIFMYDSEHYFKVPLPYGFNVMSNLGTAMAEVAGGHREMTEATMFIANSAFSSFSPISFGQSENMAKYITKAIIPTVVKPLVEIATNETYFGSSVYREQFPVGAPKPDSELAFRSPEAVQQFFSWMNKATGGSAQVPGSVDINPDQFWYGLEYYIGGAGQFVTRSLGTGRDMFEMMKEGKKVKMAANDFPFIRKLYGEVSKYYDSDKYTENTDLISQLYKERKESDDKKSDRYSGVTKLESMRKSTEKKLKLLRKKRKEAREIENYVDKQNRMQELYEKERSLLMEFNKAFEKLRGE
jgi:hypothetical protein